MTDQTPEQEARQLGWVPQEEFRGSPDKWVDAEKFLEIGKTRLPVLQENNRRLQSDVSKLQGQVQELTNLFHGSQESMKAMKQLHKETFEARLKAERERLRDELQAAREEGNLDRELEVQEQLTEVSEQVRQAKKQEETPPPSRREEQPQQLAPEFIAWQQANQWYGKDEKKTAIAMGLAHSVRASHPQLVGTAFFDKLDEELSEIYPSKPGGSKVEGARGQGGGGGGVEKSYSSLPQEAKDICDRQAKTFVGANKTYKTQAEWQKAYTKLYYEGTTE